MCISCRKQKPKRELIRIIKNDKGRFEVDESYKIQSRGMYVCRSAECVHKLKKSNKFKKIFKFDEGLEFYSNLEKIVEM